VTRQNVAVSAPGTKTRRGLTMRWRFAAPVALVLVAGLVGVTVHRLISHGDPDPGDRILTALKSIEVGVPTDAAEVTHQYAKALWDSCDGREGTFGWSDIGVYLTFATTMQPTALLTFVRGQLQGAGWTAGLAGFTPLGQGQRFVRTLANNSEAVAQISPTTRDGDPISWSLSAVAPPQGPRASGC
jgi:hypothetical protein